ncbi:hypothetical protein CMUS01_05535 [Colletotrichum musicola]|uniref:Uncharacterized protein n=1 Tax=Colletotrichum musicola TaxID=2175873 RepID=A0A8H6KR04_9PEZI|nr:hypothetical protein CMUS01_05535 [Colletotrichum musicola]
MPSFRGLNISVVPGPDDESFPELPHPDSSSVCLRGLHSMNSISSLASSPQSTPVKFKPTVSVYIPSTPGAQFHIRYSINNPPNGAQYLLFRMLMNGRQVVSWGIPSQVIPSQIVSHALYEPDNKWQYRESGVTYKREGVEKRYFYFAPLLEQTSAAMDGGVIDVQVFRCKGRKRRAPELSRFRSQDEYGITSPTGGLVESPQDLAFYDYNLLDPVDSPYANYRLFYRTWEHLKMLNLVPEFYHDRLGRSSRARENTTPETPKPPLYQTTNDEMASFTFGPLDGDVFEDKGAALYRKDEGNISFHLATPLQLTVPPVARSKFPQPSKVARDTRHCSDYLRPLPVLPGVDKIARKPSAESIRAPSVTPSLLPFVDDLCDADKIELGIARQVMLHSNSRASHAGSNLARPLPMPPMVVLSSAGYGLKPLSPSGSELADHIGPRGCMTTTESEHESHMSEHRKLEPRIGNSKGWEVSPIGNLGTTRILEGEWMRRSPSPLHRRQDEEHSTKPRVS